MSYSSKLDAIYFKDAEKIKKKTYDYIVVGGGAYGTSFVHRILELNPKSKILVLEKGSLLLPEHYQNLPRAYQNVFNYTTEQPWIMSKAPYNVHGQVPYLGGRTLYWNAWVPQPTPAQMRDWPQDVIEGLKPEWNRVAKFIGRTTTFDINGHTGDLHKVMRERLFKSLDKIPSCDYYDRASALDGAMANLSTNSDKSWRRFAPVNILIDLITKYPDNIDVLINAEATGLKRNKSGIEQIITKQGVIDVKKAKVILALGVIEAVTLVKPEFPENKLLGRNFMGHFRSQIFIRVPKKAAGVDSNLLEIATLYQSGMAVDREYHMHICCVHNPRGKDQAADFYRVTPYPSTMELFMDGEYMYFELHAMAEIRGERTADATNYISVKDGVTKIHFNLEKPELELWDTVDDVVVQVAGIMADGHKIDYLQADNKTWSPKVPDMPKMRDYNLIHEAGIMWMGDNAKDSVTDSWGRMHETDNLYVLGGAIFPTCGSWNPTYTGIAMTYRLAREFAKK